MAQIQTTGLNLNIKNQLGAGTANGVPSGGANELVMSELLGKYATLSKSGKLFYATAIGISGTIYTTAAGSGGPLIWNKTNSNVEAHLLAVSLSVTTTTSVAGALGIIGCLGQSAAPGTSAAISNSGSTYLGGQVSQMGGIYNTCTPTNAASTFFPVAEIGTGATTAVTGAPTWIDLGGAFIIPQGTIGGIGFSATLTSGVFTVGLLWAELPY